MLGLTEVIQLATAVIVAIGGAGVLLVFLSSWLGKVWANRLMEHDRASHATDLEKFKADLLRDKDKELTRLEHELGVGRSKHLGLHDDKVKTYRLGVDLVAKILGDIHRHHSKPLNNEDAEKLLNNFNENRMRLYGYLAMVAPQSVIDAMDDLIDHVLAILNDENAHEWPEVRKLVLALLRAIRVDLGVEQPNIEYRGSR